GQEGGVVVPQRGALDRRRQTGHGTRAAGLQHPGGFRRQPGLGGPSRSTGRLAQTRPALAPELSPAMAATPTDLADCSAFTLAGLYRQGSASPSEACAAVLERIERRNGHINAFVCVDTEGARAAADASTRR